MRRSVASPDESVTVAVRVPPAALVIATTCQSRAREQAVGSSFSLFLYLSFRSLTVAAGSFRMECHWMVARVSIHGKLFWRMSTGSNPLTSHQNSENMVKLQGEHEQAIEGEVAFPAQGVLGGQWNLVRRVFRLDGGSFILIPPSLRTESA